MGFYNSGFKRVTGGIQTSRSQITKNEKDDTTTKNAVDANTAKVGITGSQSAAIVSNTSSRVKTFHKALNYVEWNSAIGAGSGPGFACEGIDLRKDTILQVLFTTWNPDAVGYTPTAIANQNLTISTNGPYANAEGTIAKLLFYGARLATSAGPALQYGSMDGLTRTFGDSNAALLGTTAANLAVKPRFNHSANFPALSTQMLRLTIVFIQGDFQSFEN
tara:strand:- start:17833 stop:18489 length:657 start_codon:yes stop_codon:yes gene_type:complete